MADEIEISGEGATGETALPAGWERMIASAGLILATALQAADGSIATVALPQLEHDLGGGIELGAWVFAGYLCAAAVMAPLTGWLRRRYGARRLFPAAMGAFAVASMLCGLSPTAKAIILFRLLQGAGGGVLHPLAQAIMLDIYPKSRHGRMMGILGAGLMIGPILGPPLGGLITDLASWRWVFLINIPLGFVAIACVWRLRSTIEPPGARTVDVLGIVSLMVGVGALQLLLQRGVGLGWFHSPEIVAEAFLAAACFASLFLRARHSGFTAFRPEVFRDVNFVTAAFYNFMLSALLFVTVIFLPSLAEGPLGLPATMAGALIVPRAMLLMAVMLLVGQLMGKVDHRILLGSGWLLMAGGLIVLSIMPKAQAPLWIMLGSSIQAIGAAMLYIPLATLAFSTLAPEIRTDASGLYSLLRQLGYASGVALMSAVLQAKIAMHVAALAGGIAATPSLHAGAALRGYADCFRMMAIAAVVIIPGIFLFRAGRGRTGRAPDALRP
ncbi:MAG TPA: DHA2 family efflux MFS transporter permease subunit [Stellaceae bacterium]|nr:DHA2 family efflux MFS transporter permease subunit [Stellaceae bacterium]